jgi:glucans biosynthesis protein
LFGENLKGIDPASVKGMVTAGKAEVKNIVTQPNPDTGGWRLSFQCQVKGDPIELRAFLTQDDKPISEVWVYRWAP